MIPLKRSRAAKAIHKHFHGPGRVKLLRELLDGHAAANVVFKSHWTRAKPQLRRESHGKCAYCEAPTSVVAHGDVEHYRPKSVYWWLAYCYDNFLFACQICNQSFKSDNFPTAGVALAVTPPLPNPLPAGLTPAQLDALADGLAPAPRLKPAVLKAFHTASAAERPALPNPYELNPEPLFAWSVEGQPAEVWIRPRDPADPEHARVHDAVDRFLGLNREELRQQRAGTYAQLAFNRELLATPGMPAEAQDRVKRRIREMMGPDQPYAGMARYFVNVEWGLDLS